MSQPSTPSSTGGGSFRVDLERAPDAIRELNAALAELVSLRTEAFKLSHVDPGSRDSVSIDAARALSDAAAGGPDSLATALEAGIDKVSSLISSLEADLRSYRETEIRSGASLDRRQT